MTHQRSGAGVGSDQCCSSGTHTRHPGRRRARQICCTPGVLIRSDPAPTQPHLEIIKTILPTRSSLKTWVFGSSRRSSIYPLCLTWMVKTSALCCLLYILSCAVWSFVAAANVSCHDSQVVSKSLTILIWRAAINLSAISRHNGSSILCSPRWKT